MSKLFIFSLFSLIVSALVGCESSESVYTLYRNSTLDSSLRIHVATFDASDGLKYNIDNCQTAAELFQRQQGVTTKFWCEKGKFRK